MEKNAHAAIVGRGFYSLAEAARLLRVSPNTVGAWSRGYLKLRSDGSKRRDVPAVATAYDDFGGITFEDLVELRYVQRFRAEGFSLRKILEAAERGRAAGSQYPFTGKKWAKLFRRLIDTHEYEDAVTGARFLELAEDVWEELDIRDDEFAEGWFPMGKDHVVVLDPRRVDGAPSVKGTRIETETLYRQYLSTGKDIHRVARWFDIDESQVRDAIQFEEQWQQPVKAAG